MALRRVAVDRGYQYAVDEARRLTFAHGIDDEPEDVVTHWMEYRTWLRPPIVVTGEVTGSGYQYELLVGFTRLGNLLGLLDRAEVPEAQRHRVWRGTPVR